MTKLASISSVPVSSYSVGVTGSMALPTDGQSVQGRGQWVWTLNQSGFASATPAGSLFTTPTITPRAGRVYVLFFGGYGITAAVAAGKGQCSSTPALTWTTLSSTAVSNSTAGGGTVLYNYLHYPSDPGVADAPFTITAGMTPSSVPNLTGWGWALWEGQGSLANNGATMTLPRVQTVTGASGASAFATFLDLSDSILACTNFVGDPGVVTLPVNTFTPTFTYSLLQRIPNALGTLVFFEAHSSSTTPSNYSVTYATSPNGFPTSYVTEWYGPAGAYIRGVTGQPKFSATVSLAVIIGKTLTAVAFKVRHPISAPMVCAVWKKNVSTGVSALLGAAQSSSNALTHVQADETVTVAISPAVTVQQHEIFWGEVSAVGVGVNLCVDARLYSVEVV